MLRFLMLLLMVCLLSCTPMREYNLNDGIRSFRVQNYRHAFIRLKPEAEKGQRDAQYAIGYMYYYGQGVVEDRKKACYWITQAAKSGQPEAIVALKKIKAVPTAYPLRSTVRRVLS